MSETDFFNNFYWLTYNEAPENLKLAYWLALDNKTIGVAGKTTTCGSTCKRVVFNVTSSVA